ncbi:MAG: M20/M25/M40 family metallo-hydrolase [Myxococcales bacterium]|nr:M20/M25/M40 family metallo-hydrolase [Myxococcales bacterium]
MPTPDKVAADARARLDDTIADLVRYLTFPSISCQPDNFADVRRLAEVIRDDLTKTGLENARLLELEGALPVVVADWLHAGPDAPTLLIYGHLDIQPVELENWHTDPHVAKIEDGRLYARGSADDMGGWISHMAAISSWLRVNGTLPCNVRVLIEGEEEIGSPNLERFMDTYPEAFDADVMVLTDCENPSVDVPGLTVSLRGLMEVELHCEALGADAHSGLWGGIIPDPALALCKVISRLVDEEGRLIPGRRPVTDKMRAAAAEVPLPDKTIRDGAHLLDGVDPLPEHGDPAGVWMWRQPAITILSTTLPAPGREKNAIRKSASAKLSVRLAPDQTADEMLSALRGAIFDRPAPAGVNLRLDVIDAHGGGWLYEPKGPAFAAADRAYVKSWGRPLVQVGIGGSIPFVALFGRRFGDLPLILNGVLDPLSTAHGPNESMHLGIFEKAIAANVYLLDELGKMGKAALAR